MPPTPEIDHPINLVMELGIILFAFREDMGVRMKIEKRQFLCRGSKKILVNL